MSEDLIPLQKSYIRQSKDVRDNAWVVYSEQGEELYELPNHLDPKKAMAHVHFGRKFELDALNIGIRHGHLVERGKATVVINQLRAQIEELAAQNERLSTQLERFIIEGE